jgi:hypothetical protein
LTGGNQGGRELSEGLRRLCGGSGTAVPGGVVRETTATTSPTGRTGSRDGTGQDGSCRRHDGILPAQGGDGSGSTSRGTSATTPPAWGTGELWLDLGRSPGVGFTTATRQTTATRHTPHATRHTPHATRHFADQRSLLSSDHCRRPTGRRKNRGDDQAGRPLPRLTATSVDPRLTPDF